MVMPVVPTEWQDWLRKIPDTMYWQSHTSGISVPVAVQLGTLIWSGGCGPSELLVCDAVLWSSHCLHVVRDQEPGTASTSSSPSDSTSECILTTTENLSIEQFRQLKQSWEEQNGPRPEANQWEFIVIDFEELSG